MESAAGWKASVKAAERGFRLQSTETIAARGFFHASCCVGTFCSLRPRSAAVTDPLQQVVAICRSADVRRRNASKSRPPPHVGGYGSGTLMRSCASGSQLDKIPEKLQSDLLTFLG